MLVELDSNKEKLRQKEGWYHWVVAPQEGSEASTPGSASHLSSGTSGVGPDFSMLGAGDSPLLSAAPSEASDSVLVSACG